MKAVLSSFEDAQNNTKKKFYLFWRANLQCKYYIKINILLAFSKTSACWEFGGIYLQVKTMESETLNSNASFSGPRQVNLG